MKLLKDLNELKIGDIVKVYIKDEQKKHYKIGEIINKWKEKNNPCFELKIFETNLPLTTKQLIQRIAEAQNIEDWIETRKRWNKCSNEDRIFKLNKEEKNTLLKEMILRGLE